MADEAIQLHGRYGILEEYDMAHYRQDAKVLEIFEGSKEIGKIIIGRKILANPSALCYKEVQNTGARTLFSEIAHPRRR